MSESMTASSRVLSLSALVTSLVLACDQSADKHPGVGGGGSLGGASAGSSRGSSVSSGSTPDGGRTDAGTQADSGDASDASANGKCGPLTLPDPLSTSIAGTWNFTPEGGNARSIQVPGGGWLKQGINASSGTYATQIKVPDSGAPQTTLIEFGAVNFQATLSVDGKEVGTNTTAFTPSAFDVTKFVTPGKQHSVSVLVKGSGAMKMNGKSTVPNAAGWSSNVAQGIFRSAMLYVVPDVYISDTFVRTSVTNDTLTYDVSITNTGTASQQVTLSGALSSWNCDTFAYPAIPATTITAAPGTTNTTAVDPMSARFWPLSVACRSRDWVGGNTGSAVASPPERERWPAG